MTRIIARNSAPSSTNNPAALKKARIRNSTECTGLRAAITMNAPRRPTMHGGEERRRQSRLQHDHASAALSRPLLSDRAHRAARFVAISALPAVAIRQQPLLVVEKLLARLGGEFEIRPLDDGVDRAGLLAEAAIDAFGHVDVVARGAAAAVVARLGLDGDGLRRADRLAQLAGDAALLAVGIAAQRMLAAEARAERVPSHTDNSPSPWA